MMEVRRKMEIGNRFNVKKEHGQSIISTESYK